MNMKINFPLLHGNPMTISNKRSIVLIGANGSGKTRMSTWIEKNNEEINIHRISAQKSLHMPELTRPSEIKQVQEEFLYGGNSDNKQWLKNQGKIRQRWGNN